MYKFEDEQRLTDELRAMIFWRGEGDEWGDVRK